MPAFHLFQMKGSICSICVGRPLLISGWGQQTLPRPRATCQAALNLLSGCKVLRKKCIEFTVELELFLGTDL